MGITEAVGRLATPAGEPLAARVRIATGLVVVGGLVGEGSAREEAVVGETTNLAARLQEAADPGAVPVAEGTRPLLSGVFDLRPLGPIRPEGFARPAAVLRAGGERPAGSRFDARRTGRLLPTRRQPRAQHGRRGAVRRVRRTAAAGVGDAASLLAAPLGIEACDLLTPVYGWFAEGFGTADLRNARALLDELR